MFPRPIPLEQIWSILLLFPSMMPGRLVLHEPTRRLLPYGQYFDIPARADRLESGLAIRTDILASPCCPLPCCHDRLHSWLWSLHFENIPRISSLPSRVILIHPWSTPSNPVESSSPFPCLSVYLRLRVLIPFGNLVGCSLSSNAYLFFCYLWDPQLVVSYLLSLPHPLTLRNQPMHSPYNLS